MGTEICHVTHTKDGKMAKMTVKWRVYKCSPYIARTYNVHVEVMLYDVIVSIFQGVGLIAQYLMGRKQPS